MSANKDKEFSFDINTEIEEVPEKRVVKSSIYDAPLDAFIASGKNQVSITNPKVNGEAYSPDYVRQQLVGRVDKVPRFKGIMVRVVGNTVYIFKETPTKKPKKTKDKTETPEPTQPTE